MTNHKYSGKIRKSVNKLYFRHVVSPLSAKLAANLQQSQEMRDRANENKNHNDEIIKDVNGLLNELKTNENLTFEERMILHTKIINLLEMTRFN